MQNAGKALGLCVALLCPALLQPDAQKTPVMLELFTSLGCSSCPSADKLLAELDRQQPIAGARLIVLSEHVDYWNNANWTDPFSSAAYTERQQAYDARLRVEPYTPQLVIDGTAAVLGSDWHRASEAIRALLGGARVAVLVAAARDGGRARIDIKADAGETAKKAIVSLALARARAESHVSGGENAGRDLSEVAVAYSIKQLGKIERGTAFEKSISVELPAHSQAGDLRAIVFVHRPDTMQMIGAGEADF